MQVGVRCYTQVVSYTVHTNIQLNITDNLGVEVELIAESVFITITDAFNKYRAKVEAANS